MYTKMVSITESGRNEAIQKQRKAVKTKKKMEETTSDSIEVDVLL